MQEILKGVLREILKRGMCKQLEREHELLKRGLCEVAERKIVERRMLEVLERKLVERRNPWPDNPRGLRRRMGGLRHPGGGHRPRRTGPCGGWSGRGIVGALTLSSRLAFLQTAARALSCTMFRSRIKRLPELLLAALEPEHDIVDAFWILCGRKWET